ncbi:hypothetical protein ACIQMY_01800 [Streptomyces sp. NPDC091368]|uniref:hypothetical protein n=1 Tax=Streptomyces sp. NPDC091368 TaxID=3365993 RepID=UPI00382B617A
MAASSFGPISAGHDSAAAASSASRNSTAAAAGRVLTSGNARASPSSKARSVASAPGGEPAQHPNLRPVVDDQQPAAERDGDPERADRGRTWW